MTLETLQQLFPAATAETWHQHVNPDGTPGGWVNNQAQIAPTAFVSTNAVVPGEWATVGEGATVGARAKVGEWATVGEGAKVGEWAKVGEGATWNVSPLCIIGTRHLLCVPAPGRIKIGCMDNPVEWWEEHYRAAGRSEGYTKEQINEYRNYIALAKYWMKIHCPVVAEEVKAA